MKPIRDIKDIENLKTDEKLIEFCLNGKVNKVTIYHFALNIKFNKK